MKMVTNTVDGDTDKGGVEAVLSRESGKLEGGFRTKDVKRTRKDGLQSHRTCFVGPRPRRLWGV